MTKKLKHFGASVERRVSAGDLLTDALIGGAAGKLKKLAQSVTLRRGANPSVLKGTVDGAAFSISRDGGRNFAPGFPADARRILLELIGAEETVPINALQHERPGLRAL